MPVTFRSLVLVALFAVGSHSANDRSATVARANALYSASASISPGTYMITSIASGDQWTYSVGPGASMAPGSGTPIIVNAATQGGTFSFEAGNGKCLSAQWTGSFDGTGILYACTPSANADASNGGVRSAKQMWILLPANGSSRGVANVGGGSLISKGSGSSGLSKKKKIQEEFT